MEHLNLIINGKSANRSFTSNSALIQQSILGDVIVTSASYATFSDVKISGNLTIRDNARFQNNILMVNQSLTIGKNITNSTIGSATVFGNTSIGNANTIAFNGYFSTMGNTSIGSAGTINFTGNVYTGGNFDLGQTSTLNFSGTTLFSVLGNASFAKSTTVNLTSGDFSVGGDLNNAGLFINFGKTIFNGSTTQNINTASTGFFLNKLNTALSTALFENLTVSNNINLLSLGYGASINKPVCNHITFTGKYVVNNSTIPVSMIGTLTNPYSGLFTGKLKRKFATATNFTTTGDFPVTKGNSYRNARIEYTVAPTKAGFISVEFIDSAAGAKGLPLTDDIPLSTTESDGFWRVETDSVTGGFFTLTLSNTNAAMRNKVSVLSALRSLVRSKSSSNWVLNGIHGVNTGSVTYPSVVRTGMNSFGDNVIAGGAANNLFYVRTDTLNLIGCINVVYKGITYTNAATIKDTIKATVGGYDSVYYLVKISVANIVPTVVNNTISGCGQVVFNGKTYTATTLVKDTIKSIQGCDSIYKNTQITISSILSVSINSISNILCATKKLTCNAVGTTGLSNATYQWFKNGNNVGTNSATYSDSSLQNNDSIWCVFTTTDNCYTVKTATSNKLHITVVQPSALTNATASIIQGQTYNFNGQSITTAGIYTSTFTNVSGCDSVVKLNVTVIAAICNPFSGTSLHNSVGFPSIDSVIIPGTSLKNSSPGTNANGYAVFTNPTLIPDLTQGITYTLSTKFSGTAIASVWFDWNNSKTFEASEWSQVSFNVNQGIINFTVPMNAATGLIWMRVRARSSTPNGATNACTQFGSGETEDYLINIIAAAPCSGTIQGGTTLSTNNPVCANTAFTLSVSGDTKGFGGLNYLWQNSLDGVNWVDITNATNETYTATAGINVQTIYRRKITCAAGSSDYSLPIGVSVNNPVGLVTATKTSICPGEKVVFTASVLNGGTSPVYQWKKNGVNAGINSAVYADSLLAKNDSIWCNITSNSTCVAIPTVTSNKIIINVSNIPTIPTISGDTLVANGTDIILNAASTDATSYSWIGPNSFVSNNQSITVSAATSINAGVYSVIAKNACGQSSVSSVNITVFTKKPKTLLLDKVSCYSGNFIDVNIRTKNFTNVASLQGSIVWDTSVLRYQSFITSSSNIHIDSATNIGLTQTNNGLLTYLWYDTIGHSTMDSTILFGIRFMPIKNNASPSMIQFSSSPTSLAIDTASIITHLPQEIFDTAYINGYIIPIAKPTVMASYNNPVAIADTLQLTATGSSSNTYTWTGPNGFVSSDQNPSIYSIGLVNSGTYYVSANYSGCTSNTDSIVVQVLSDFVINGNTRHPLGAIIKNVSVMLKGNNATMTNNTSLIGEYNFTAIAKKSYTLKPIKNNDIIKANGINTADVLFVQRHILNTNKITNPYKLIAADVTGDGKINATDILRIKRLVLGSDTTFTKGSGINKVDRLWEFVDSAYVFPDTTNPFPFKDSISFNNLISNKNNQTFIGIKLGDVNYDWKPAIAKAIVTKPVEFVYTTRNEESGIWNSVVRIPITANNFRDLVAMQYTLHFNNNSYEFVAIENNTLGIDFNSQTAIQNGNISFLWTDKNADEKTLDDGTELFVLVLKQKGIGNWEFGISDAITEVSAWDKDFNHHNIILIKRETINEQPTIRTEYFSVSPNPTTGIIKVDLVAKTNKTIHFELSDVKGRILLQQNFDAIKGNNSIGINLKKNTHLPNGIYFLKANGLEGEDVKKIVVR